MSNKQLFEIRIYKDEYAKNPIKVCSPDFIEFSKAINEASSKHIEEKELPVIFEKVCKESTMCLRRSLKNGLVVCIAVKDDVSEAEMSEYYAAGELEDNSNKKIEKEEKKLIKKASRKRKAKAKIKASKKKRTAKKVKQVGRVYSGKRGRPSLPEAEKKRRAALKEAAHKRSGGKRGRPKGSTKVK